MATATPEVTVVVPTHQRPRLLARTLASVCRQVDVDLEVVVVDDGSPDAEAVRAALPDDPRVRLLRHESPEGVGAARNRGIAEARGRWVATLDDDDLWRPRKLAAQLEALQADHALWCMVGAVHVREGARIWRLDPPPSPSRLAELLPQDNVVPAGSSNVLVRREVVTGLGGFDEGLAQTADWDMWLRLLREGPPATVDEYLLGYRLHDRNMALQNVDGLEGEAAVLDRRHGDLRGGRPLDRTSMHYWVAVSHWRAGDRKGARAAYLRACRDGRRSALLRYARALVPIQRLRVHEVLPPWPPGFLEWWLEADTDPAGVDG